MTSPAHSRLAPSSADRWVHCPGSVQLEEQYPDPGGDEDARDGNVCHAIAAAALTAEAAEPIPATQEIEDAARVYYDAIMSIHGGAAAKIWVEDRVSIPQIHPECFGTVDSWFLGKSAHLHIFDLKYGWGLIEAPRRWQNILYALGVCARFPDARPEIVHLHIVQPRPYHPDGPHRTWSITYDQLMGYAEQARSAAIGALSSSPVCTTGGWCKYCSAVVQCRAAQLVWPTLWEVSGSIASADHSPQQLALELSLLTRAESIIEARRVAVEATALGMARDGVEIPGWQVGRTAGKKVWSAGAEEVQTLADLYGVNVRKPGDLITPTQAVKAGLPADIVAQYTTITAGSPRMEPVNPNKTSAKELFDA